MDRNEALQAALRIAEWTHKIEEQREQARSLREMMEAAEALLRDYEDQREQELAKLTAPPVVVIDGGVSGMHADKLPARLLDRITREPARAFSADDLMDVAGDSNIQTVRSALGRLAEAGKVHKPGRGLFQAIADEPPTADAANGPVFRLPIPAARLGNGHGEEEPG